MSVWCEVDRGILITMYICCAVITLGVSVIYLMNGQKRKKTLPVKQPTPVASEKVPEKVAEKVPEKAVETAPETSPEKAAEPTPAPVEPTPAPTETPAVPDKVASLEEVAAAAAASI